MTEALLSVRGLCTFYGTSQALFGVSLEVPQKGCVTVLGRNGAGKTTLLNALVGELPPRAGDIRFGGTEVTARTTEWRIRHGLGYVPQEQAIFGSLSVRENLRIGALCAGERSAALDEVVQLFPRLGERLTQQAGTLSGGERKMLAISRALLGRPKLLLLDEPTEGVWHGVIEEIAQRLETLARHMAILIVEQNVRLALRLSQYSYVMDRGRIALEGPSARVRDDPDLMRLLAP